MINYVIVQEKNGKHYASAHKEHENQNFADKFRSICNLSILHFFPSFKKANETANFWNQSYKINGTLMSSDEVTAACFER